jgi:hypothetical protein
MKTFICLSARSALHFCFSAQPLASYLFALHVGGLWVTGERLQPAVSGLILALLPGLEDEQNELYTRVLALLHAIREGTTTPVFMLSLWRCLLFCPQCRLSAVNYLAVTVPKGPLQMKK